MKNLGKFAVLGAVLAASASSAFAATITLGSWSSQANVSPYTANPGNPGDANTAIQFDGANLVTTYIPGTTAGTASFQAPITTPVSAAYYQDPTTVWKTPPLTTSEWVGTDHGGWAAGHHPQRLQRPETRVLQLLNHLQRDRDV